VSQPKTKQRAVTYCGLAIICFLGLYIASRPDVVEFVRIAAGTPAIGSLLGALFLLLRDDIAFERELLRDEIAHERTTLRDEIAYERGLKTKDSENAFSIGALSHMAEVAFNKHVEFCDEYIKKTIDVIDKLLQSGPDQEAMRLASGLLAVRQRWVVWLTPEIEHALEPFERAVRKVGTDSWLLKNSASFDDRHKVVERVYAIYSEVLGIKEFNGGEVSSEKTVQTIVDELRRVLGIKELTELRSRFVRRAHLSLSADPRDR